MFTPTPTPTPHPTPTGAIPAMIPAARGGARVRLPLPTGGRADVYCGRWGTPAAREQYDSILQAWLANDRRWPPPHTPCPTLAELMGGYLAHARVYYTKHGRETKSVHRVRRCQELLGFAGLTPLAPAAFGPPELIAFQQYLAGDPHSRWSRNTINDFTTVIVQAFEWAVTQRIIPAAAWQSLKAVRPLRRGRCPGPGLRAPREGVTVPPVPPAHLAAALALARPLLRAMIELQLAAAMRPCEVVNIRGQDIYATINPAVFAYKVPAAVNKTDHHETARTVYLGPRAMAILTPWLLKDPAAYIFSPRRALDEHNAARAAARVTPLCAGNSKGEHTARNRKAGILPLRVGARYTTDSYGRAIARLCAAASTSQPWKWSPNQLRHSAATYIATNERVEVARILLGHADITTTMQYVQIAEHTAVAAAARIA